MNSNQRIKEDSALITCGKRPPSVYNVCSEMDLKSPWTSSMVWKHCSRNQQSNAPTSTTPMPGQSNEAESGSKYNVIAFKSLQSHWQKARRSHLLQRKPMQRWGTTWDYLHFWVWSWFNGDWAVAFTWSNQRWCFPGVILFSIRRAYTVLASVLFRWRWWNMTWLCVPWHTCAGQER